MDGELEDGLAKLGNIIQDEGGILKDEGKVFLEIRLVFGGGEMMEGGLGKAGAGLVPNGSSPEEMAASVKQDLPKFQALVKSIGIKPE